MKHVVVSHREDYFTGWPANHGVWSWGDEILVGYKYGVFEKKSDDHSIDRAREGETRGFARSYDGGVTWTQEDPGMSALLDAEPVPPSSRIDFAHPDLALRVNGRRLVISYDRGQSFEGPYLLPSFGSELTSRTDYIVNGRDECLFFMSHKRGEPSDGRDRLLLDRSFCAITRDGGLSYEFLASITSETEPIRSVMSSTVKGRSGQLLTALRRRSGEQGFIDIYQSDDNGMTWLFLSRAAETGRRNGNPPAMIRLSDDRLCLAYGDRDEPIGIKARVSHDHARTWSEEILLRSSDTWDIGYPRMIEREDGRLVVIYYIHRPAQFREQFIEACIWHPDEL